MNFRTGTVSASEWDGLWKSGAKDPDATEEEFEAANERLENALSPYVDILYARGDYFGDRTLYVEIITPEGLTKNVLTDLQKWLLRDENKIWRIVIPCHLGVRQKDSEP
jgi:hypothetical protein